MVQDSLNLDLLSLSLSLSLIKNEVLYLLYSFKIVKIRDSNQFKERIRIFFH